jgi:DMSO/TMAO reductase YedYZ molybdopterin-dependent catalytic subunit
MNRRHWLMGALATLAAGLGACGEAGSRLAAQAGRMAEGLTRRAQRLLIPADALAPTYDRSDISPDFRPNGSISPAASDYVALREGGFAAYRLQIDGLVERPISLSLVELRTRPTQTQITKHDCVEGWTSIAEWTGVRLETLLDEAGLKPEARFIVFHCFDALDQTEGGDRYYESIDLVDARHPQTILAWAMNGETLPVPHGAPLRLRVERQLGYKHAKYIKRIEAVASLDGIGGGKGGYWEDRGYEWFAAI